MDLTRKQALTGLAGILATGVAPAAFVKSMIGARGVAFSKSGSSAWVNPYATDGLVAMWDGEWNAGGGVHSALPIATNLAPNQPDPIVTDTGLTMGDNYYNTSESSRILFNYNNESGSVSNVTGCSVECVWEPNNLNRGKYLFKSDNGGWYSQDGYSLRWVSFLFSGWSASAHAPQIGVKCSIQSRLNNRYSRASPSSYVNGIATGSNSNAFQYTSGPSFISFPYDMSCKVYSFRFYERVLTESEIAANYAIDKARFGLT